MVGQITGKNELKKNGSGYSDPTAYKAIMNVGGATVMNMYRGDIFYTENTVGNETPVIIITPNDVLEKNPDYVYTILMTTKEKDQSPTHVEVMCKVPSVALCERIYGTNVERIGEYIRSCTEEEMQRIDEAIMLTLGIKKSTYKCIGRREDDERSIVRTSEYNVECRNISGCI